MVFRIILFIETFDSNMLLIGLRLVFPIFPVLGYCFFSLLFNTNTDI